MCEGRMLSGCGSQFYQFLSLGGLGAKDLEFSGDVKGQECSASTNKADICEL